LTNNSLTIGRGNQRRFLPPWSVEETTDCFIIRDVHVGRRAYVCYGE